MPKPSSIRSVVSIEHRLVTDTDTGHGQYRGYIASRGKNQASKELSHSLDTMAETKTTRTVISSDNHRCLVVPACKLLLY